MGAGAAADGRGGTLKAARVTETTCCIAGGGPAGLMLGFLLARSGVDVTVIEKHADFLRDFRGDTIHPSTMEIMHELGFLDEFLKLPHEPVPRLAVQFGASRFDARRFLPSCRSGAVHRDDAAVGLPQFHRRERRDGTRPSASSWNARRTR